MPDIFLSYSREDQPTARRFAEALKGEGFNVWWDQALTIGEAFDKITENALDEAKAVVVLWSKHSVDSRWVRAEATQAQAHGRLAPVMIEACRRPIMFELTHTADLSGWNGDTRDARWQSFVSELRRFLGSTATADASFSTFEKPAVGAGNGRPRRPMALAIAALAVLAIIGALLWRLGRMEPPSSATPTTARAAPATLAVLPFANLSGDPEQEYYSDGLTEEILNQLAQIAVLRVTGRTSSFAFKGKNEDLRAIARQLGVANLLEGSIRKEDQTLRITAQLIDGADGAHLWSRTYDRELRNVFAVQKEIAKDVAQALSVRLDVGATSRARGGTTNVEAYEKYLRAKASFNQRDFPSSERLYRETLELDPEFVDAWYGLALAQLPLDTDLSQSAIVVSRLETLAPGSWQLQLARAVQLRQGRKYAESMAALATAETAAASSALNVDALQALNLIWVGRVRDSRPFIQRMLEADPLSLLSSGWMQYNLAAMGQMDEALAEHERSRALPGYSAEEGSRTPLVADLSHLYAIWSREGDAVAQTRAWFTPFRQRDPLLRSVSDSFGDPAAARQALQRAFDNTGGQDATDLIWIVVFADHFGDRDLALGAMRRMVIDMGSNYNQYLWLPFTTKLRADARFKEIVQHMGLVDYWRSSGKWADFCKPVGDTDFECN